MDRRIFLQGCMVTTLGLASVTGIGAGAFFAIEHGNPEHLTLESILVRLQKLRRSEINLNGDWSAFHMFSHLAQSIELSMTGYPQHKPEIFKRTVGSLAFKGFSAKGRMHHNLNEDIPGVEVPSEAGNTGLAMDRLMRAILNFEHFSGDLQPHFAYGPLTKPEYSMAHVLHFNNHMQSLT